MRGWAADPSGVRYLLNRRFGRQRWGRGVHFSYLINVCVCSRLFACIICRTKLSNQKLLSLLCQSSSQALCLFCDYEYRVNLPSNFGISFLLASEAALARWIIVVISLYVLMYLVWRDKIMDWMQNKLR